MSRIKEWLDDLIFEIRHNFGLIEFICLICALFVLAGTLSAFCALRESTKGEERCLRAGYTEFRATFHTNGFCIRRVDQTDEVIPLEKVKP